MRARYASADHTRRPATMSRTAHAPTTQIASHPVATPATARVEASPTLLAIRRQWAVIPSARGSNRRTGHMRSPRSPGRSSRTEEKAKSATRADSPAARLDEPTAGSARAEADDAGLGEPVEPFGDL